MQLQCRCYCPCVWESMGLWPKFLSVDTDAAMGSGPSLHLTSRSLLQESDVMQALWLGSNCCVFKAISLAHSVQGCHCTQPTQDHHMAGSPVLRHEDAIRMRLA